MILIQFVSIPVLIIYLYLLKIYTEKKNYFIFTQELTDSEEDAKSDSEVASSEVTSASDGESGLGQTHSSEEENDSYQEETNKKTLKLKHEADNDNNKQQKHLENNEKQKRKDKTKTKSSVIQTDNEEGSKDIEHLQKQIDNSHIGTQKGKY